MKVVKLLKLLPCAVTGAFVVWGAGCAHGPSGGPSSTVNAPNRLTVTLTLAQAVNSQYYYAFAFDDDDDSSDGPLAIISSSDSANGLVTGSSNTNNGANASEGFTVIVTYHAGQFSVARRTPRSSGPEKLEFFSNAFVSQGNSPGVSGNQIIFTLNLDVRNSGSGTFLFRHNSATAGDLAFTQLDTNFVTTNEIINGSQNNLVKPYDAFGQNTTGRNGNTYETYDIRSSQTFTGSNVEDSGDVFNSDSSLPDSNAQAQLDITAYRIDVRRKTSPTPTP